MYHYPHRPIYQDQHDRAMLILQNQQLEGILNDPKIPIGSNATLKTPVRTGVVKIENIPYTVTRQEVSQFFGRGARLAQEWPIHIMMERSTGKTTDCFVEFPSNHDAREAVKRANRNLDIGQGPRMGIRHIDVSLSNQDQLMKAMFPLAKCVKWVDGRPIMTPKRPGEDWSTGFVGFLTNEEMFCAIRHSENPQRSAFAYKVPQRTYEFMISTMHKFPWHATNMYTVHERNKIFQALRFMIEALVERMKHEKVVGLDTRLIQQLVHTGLRCPAFNPRMKFCLAYVGEDQKTLQHMSEVWLTYFPFDTLTWMAPCDPVALEFYASLLTKAHVANHTAKGLMQRWNNNDFLELYGRFWFEWDDQMIPKGFTFADCVNYEKNVLRGMLTSGFNNHQAELKAAREYKKGTEDDSTTGSLTPTPKPSKRGSRVSSSEAAVWNPQPQTARVAPASQTAQSVLPSGVLDPNYQFPSRRQAGHVSHASESWVPSWLTDHPFSPTLETQHGASRSESHAREHGQDRGRTRDQGREQEHARGHAPGREQTQTQGRGQSQFPLVPWATTSRGGRGRGGSGARH